MKLEIINTGTELLLGSVLNRHVTWFGRELFPLGVRISRQSTVPDGADIRSALLDAWRRDADVIIVTGGLGPTADDVTREIVAELLGLPLTEDAGVIAAIKSRCDRRGIAFRERMARQAQVPQGAEVLPNHNGTAPGLYIPPVRMGASQSPRIFLLPGPPRELYPMASEFVLPRLRGLLPPQDRELRTYRIVGMGETALEEKIGLEIQKSGNLEVGYCARPNEVDFRLIGPSRAIDAWHEQILAVAGDHFVCLGECPMEQVVVELLAATKTTVATAESCTGGLISHRLTNISGASAVFLQGVVSYSNASKSSLLGVPDALLSTHGAVSEQVAKAMAEGILAASGADYSIATTGVAGPSGGTETTPLGTVFVALAGKSIATSARRESFPTDRETFKQLASQSALDLLRRALVERSKQQIAISEISASEDPSTPQANIPSPVVTT